MILKSKEFKLYLQLPISEKEKKLLFLMSDNVYHSTKEIADWLEYWNRGTAVRFFKKCANKFNLDYDFVNYYGFRVNDNIYIE